MANFDDQPILVLGSAENSAFLARCAYREPAITETGVWPLQRQPRAIRATDTLAGIYDAEQADGSTLRNLVRSEVNSLTWTVISPLHIVTTTDGTTGQYEEEMIQILVRPESTTPEKAGEVASRVWNVLKRFDCHRLVAVEIAEGQVMRFNGNAGIDRTARMHGGYKTPYIETFARIPQTGGSIGVGGMDGTVGFWSTLILNGNDGEPAEVVDLAATCHHVACPSGPEPVGPDHGSAVVDVESPAPNVRAAWRDYLDSVDPLMADEADRLAYPLGRVLLSSGQGNTIQLSGHEPSALDWALVKVNSSRLAGKARPTNRPSSSTLSTLNSHQEWIQYMAKNQGRNLVYKAGYYTGVTVGEHSYLPIDIKDTFEISSGGCYSVTSKEHVIIDIEGHWGPFASKGDSGAMVRDPAGHVMRGMLWGGLSFSHKPADYSVTVARKGYQTPVTMNRVYLFTGMPALLGSIKAGLSSRGLANAVFEVNP